MKQIKCIDLTNHKGLQVKLTNFGARILSIKYSYQGHLMELHEYYPLLEVYKIKRKHTGATLGPFAGRLSRKPQYNTPARQDKQTDSVYSLHSGDAGFHLCIWDIKEQKDDYVVFELNQTTQEHSFKVYVTYMLTLDNGIMIQWEMKSDSDMYINMSHHAYFNLDQSDTLDHHRFMIQADMYIPLRPNKIPTGHVIPVQDSVYDLRTLQAINSERYDHSFVIDKPIKEMGLAAKAVSMESGITLSCYTTQPCVHFYTQNGRFFSLETQHYPDNPNQKNFPSSLVAATEGYKEQCLYRFSHQDEKFNPFG